MINRFISSSYLKTLLPAALLTSHILVNEPGISILEATPETGRNEIVIAQVSDLHIGKNQRRVHRKAARMLNSLNPDIIVITGDSTGSRECLPALGEWLDSIESAEDRRFAIPGNWEYDRFPDITRLDSFFTGHGVRLLVNESVLLGNNGEQIRITGLDDVLFGQPDYEMLKRRNMPGRDIILIHEPEGAIAAAGKTDGALILSGHTHGGQITFFGKALYTPEGSAQFVAGAYQLGTSQLFVSRGIGTSTVNLRIGSRPDIVLVRIPGSL